jgi:hypothetical protein
MLAGLGPFVTNNPAQVYARIHQGIPMAREDLDGGERIEFTEEEVKEIQRENEELSIYLFMFSFLIITLIVDADWNMWRIFFSSDPPIIPLFSEDQAIGMFALFFFLTTVLQWILERRSEKTLGEGYVYSKKMIENRKAEERKREAAKKAGRPTKKVFFGLWERDLTTREMLNEWIYKPALEEIRTARERGDSEQVSEVLQRLGIEDSDSSDDSSERRKAGVVDYLDAATMVRCTHCDGPTEGGPRRGTYLCAPCGFLFDSNGNTI